MDEKQLKNMRKRKLSYIFLVSLLVVGMIMPDSVSASEPRGKKKRNKELRIEWSQTKMDSTWNPASENAASLIIKRYKPSVDSLDMVVGHTKKELRKNAPESPLSNLAADIVLIISDNYLTSKQLGHVDLALTNFGGIRTDIKEGAVTVSDIFSVFPFDNRLVVIDIRGKYIKEIVESFIKDSRMEVLSGVKLIIHKDKSYSLKIGGQPVEDEKIYKLATIDFMLNGGDKVYALQKCESVVETNIVMRDAVIRYFKDKESAGELVDSDCDGRVVIEE